MNPEVEVKRDENSQSDGNFPGLSAEFCEQLNEAVQSGKIDQLEGLIKPLHPADVADAITSMDEETRGGFLELLGSRIDATVLSYLDEEFRLGVLQTLGPEIVAELVTDLDSDDAIEIIEDLSRNEQFELLAAVPAENRAIIVEGLNYPEDSAGRLMQRELVSVPPHWTVGKTIDMLRQDDGHPQDFYAVFVVDIKYKPIGVIVLSRLICANRDVTVSSIMERNFKIIDANTDKEDIGLLFSKYGLVSAPVVDAEKRLVGVITVDDVVDVVEEEAEEDLLYLSGLSTLDVGQSSVMTARHRFPWLLLNLGAAIVASMVIAQFEATIQKFVALAILMPIIPSLAGNTGTQALTVSIRALALRELQGANASKVLKKEVAVGLLNGLLLAFLTALISGWWFDNVALGIIVAVSIVANMAIAGFVGVFVPLMISKTRIDPAVASGVFLTTITDVSSFFIFLALAAVFLF